MFRDVAPVRRDDERRVDLRREEAGRDEEVRPDDVGLRRVAYPPAQLEEAALAARAAIEHREVDLVPAFAQHAHLLLDERAEIGVGRPRVHLRDDEDLHAVRPASRDRPRPRLRATVGSIASRMRSATRLSRMITVAATSVTARITGRS